MVQFIIIVLCVGFAMARFLLPSSGIQKRDIFKDLAHVFVGGLFGAAFAGGEPWLWACASALTFAEVVAFIVKPKPVP